MTDFATALSLDQARECVLAACRARVLVPEDVPLARAAGRFLAADVRALHDVPPFANAAMDGCALRGSELPEHGERRFRIAATLHAGGGTTAQPGRGECVRIMTGAPMPQGTDTVVIREHVRIDGDCAVIAAGERAGANVRAAGEDCARDAVVIRAGQRLTPARIGLAAACGHARLRVGGQPRLSLYATGDELVEPGQPLAPGQIHESNRQALAASLGDAGIEPRRSAVLRDEPARLATALREAAADSDVIVCSGGVSAGDADFLPDIVAELGVVHFHKVRIKPGMPMLFGEIGSALVFALPGNPVSALTNFALLVRPALEALQGGGEPPSPGRARLAVAFAKRHARTELVRVRLDWSADGHRLATPLRAQGSGMLTGIAEADALMLVPEMAHELPAGALVEILPLP